MMIGFNNLGKIGQLGNQMFQYAALMGIADKLGIPFCIPNHREIKHDGLGNRLRTELFAAFKINPPFVGTVNTDIVIAEKGFEFDPSIFAINIKNDFSLNGYFQTEKYSAHIKDKVKREFNFHDSIIEECKGNLKYFDNPVSMHIRRGDYQIKADNHHNLSLEYFVRALEFFPDRQVVVFSDDKEWCGQQMLFDDDRFLIPGNSGPYHDMYLMTQCTDFIIANSTFSWWGAWLANRGRVICPNVWFGPENANKSTKDLFPPHWEVIPYS